MKMKTKSNKNSFNTKYQSFETAPLFPRQSVELNSSSSRFRSSSKPVIRCCSFAGLLMLLIFIFSMCLAGWVSLSLMNKGRDYQPPYLYLSSHGDRNIMKFSRDGKLISSNVLWGNLHNSELRGMTLGKVDGKEVLYVADASNPLSRILAFGECSSITGMRSMRDPPVVTTDSNLGAQHPYSLAVDPSTQRLFASFQHTDLVMGFDPQPEPARGRLKGGIGGSMVEYLPQPIPAALLPQPSHIPSPQPSISLISTSSLSPSRSSTHHSHHPSFSPSPSRSFSPTLPSFSPSPPSTSTSNDLNHSLSIPSLSPSLSMSPSISLDPPSNEPSSLPLSDLPSPLPLPLLLDPTDLSSSSSSFPSLSSSFSSDPLLGHKLKNSSHSSPSAAPVSSPSPSFSPSLGSYFPGTYVQFGVLGQASQGQGRPAGRGEGVRGVQVVGGWVCVAHEELNSVLIFDKHSGYLVSSVPLPRPISLIHDPLSGLVFVGCKGRKGGEGRRLDTELEEEGPLMGSGGAGAGGSVVAFDDGLGERDGKEDGERFAQKAVYSLIGMKHPAGLAVFGDVLFVADLSLHRVHSFSISSQRYLKMVVSPTMLEGRGDLEGLLLSPC